VAMSTFVSVRCSKHIIVKLFKMECLINFRGASTKGVRM
jgi:hypothetical protein